MTAKPTLPHHHEGDSGEGLLVRRKRMNARIELPAIFQDGMVLQREKPLRFFGKAAEDVQKITVEIGGTRISEQVTDGRFYLEFPMRRQSSGNTVRFYVNQETEPELELSDVSFGDVWLACGQSNMEFFLRYDAHWNDIKRWEPDPDVHMYNVPRISFDGQPWRHEEDSGFWFGEGNERAFPVFSAPGYVFAREIQKARGIPVGIVGCNWGGTPACAWMDESYMAEEPLNVFEKEYQAEVDKWDPEELKKASLTALANENSYMFELQWRTMMYGLTWEEQTAWKENHQDHMPAPLGPWHHCRPGGLYHTMVETIAPMAIKGIIWYQGESDSNHADIYDQTMKALIGCFRDTFKDPSLPFLTVQLAPFERWLDCTADNYPLVREMQDKTAHEVQNSYMTSIMDLGDHDDIHPKFKKEVGERLALLARGHVYGEDILCDPPELTSCKAEGKQVIFTFAHAEGSFSLGKDPLACFEVFSGGRKLAAVSLKAEENMLCLELSEKPEAPLRVQFAEMNYCEVQIWNQAGLPVKPFTCEIAGEERI